MDFGLKQRWIDALRSGEYKQIRHKFRYADNHFCAIGVLQHIQEPEGEGNLSSSELGHIMTMNDSEGKTFDEIAKWIDANIKVT